MERSKQQVTVRQPKELQTSPEPRELPTTPFYKELPALPHEAKPTRYELSGVHNQRVELDAFPRSSHRMTKK